MTKNNLEIIRSLYSDITILNKKIEEISEYGPKAIDEEIENLKLYHEKIIRYLQEIIKLIKIEDNLKNKETDYFDLIKTSNYEMDCYEKLKEYKISEYTILFNTRKKHNTKLKSVISKIQEN